MTLCRKWLICGTEHPLVVKTLLLLGHAELIQELQEVWFLSNNVRPAREWWEIKTVDLDQGGWANPEFAEQH